MSNRDKFFLFFICLIFLFTRLYKINDIPSSVYWDEASIGYNAYSIGLTGKDEWGDFLPIHFRAFGEFKLPVYIYATLISVKLFGLNELSVRLPAVFFSLGILLITYFLSREFFKDSLIALFTTISLTFSSWFFILSRTGIEATAGLMFYLLGILLFLSSRRWLFLFSIVSFILSMYSYNSFRLLSPLVILILLLFRIKRLRVYTKQDLTISLFVILIFILSIVPIYRLFSLDNGIARIQNLGGVSEPTRLIGNYLAHFSPSFLFGGDNNIRFQQKGFGQIHILEIFLFSLGLFFIFRKRQSTYCILFLLLFIAPLPASLTKEAPHALRSISIIPFICILIGCGLKNIYDFTTKKNIVISVFLLIYLIFFSNYFYNFNFSYPKYAASDWQFAYKEVYRRYSADFDKFDQVIISDTFAQPYIFALFYLKYNPNKFIQEVKRNEVGEWGFSTVSNFDKFHFGKLKNIVSNETKNAIVFSDPDEVLGNYQPIDIIKFPDGSTALFVYQL